MSFYMVQDILLEFFEIYVSKYPDVMYNDIVTLESYNNNINRKKGIYMKLTISKKMWFGFSAVLLLLVITSIKTTIITAESSARYKD